MKKKLTTVFASMALVFGLGFGLTTPAAAAQTCDPGKGGIDGGIECAKPPGAAENLFGSGSIFENITNILLFLVGALSVIMIIFGAIRYVTSGGDAKQVESAKNTILYAIIGLILAILAFAIIRFVTGVFVV